MVKHEPGKLQIISGLPVINYCAEVNEDRTLDTQDMDNVSAEMSYIMSKLEEAFGTGSSCMNYTFSRSGMSSLGKISYFSIM